MFDGLDDIDWEDFGECHLLIGMKSKDIPDNIRHLLHENPEERKDAIGFLLGRQQHLGMIGEATPYIIPFVLEVLEEYPDYHERGYLMFGFSMMFIHMFRGETFEHLRLVVAVYDALSEGYSIYKRLLNDEDQDVRSSSVLIMTYMQGHAVDAVTALFARLKIEDDEEIRESIIDGIIKLIWDTKGICLSSSIGLDFVQNLYAYLRDKGSFDDKVMFAYALNKRHFTHDNDIQIFIAQVKEQAERTGKWDDYE